MKVYNVVNHNTLLGEGPLWDNRTNSIIWVDILNSQILQFYPDTKVFHIRQVGKKISALALREHGGFIASAENGFGWLNLDKPSFTYISEPEKNIPNNRFNDGKCDPKGRFWAGSMNSIDDSLAHGNLYTIDQDLITSVKIQDVGCSNGLAWNVDLSVFYYIDTPTRQVVAYDYDPEEGSISNRRVVITIPAKDGLPDGMTIDTEGMLWIACWNGWKVSRWNPNTGSLISSIQLPVAQVSSCTFGGPDLTDLYITTASVGLTVQELQKQPLAGALFVAKNCGAQGFSGFKFER